MATVWTRLTSDIGDVPWIWVPFSLLVLKWITMFFVFANYLVMQDLPICSPNILRIQPKFLKFHINFQPNYILVSHLYNWLFMSFSFHILQFFLENVIIQAKVITRHRLCPQKDTWYVSRSNRWPCWPSSMTFDLYFVKEKAF